MLGVGGTLAGRTELNEGPLIRLNRAAKKAGVTTRSITRWQDAGDLTDHRTNGGHRRVDLAELRALLARRKREAYDRTAK